MKKNIFICFIIVIGFIGIQPIYLFAQSGWSFQTNPPGSSSLGKIQFVSSTEGWISESYGKLLHTTNAGTDWIIETPFPSDTAVSMSDPAISMWWVNQTHGWKINWFGTGFGDAHGAVIYKTTDGGGTWERKVLSTAIGEMGFQVQFVDTNNGWASIYNPSGPTLRTLRSTDGGTNWDTIGTAGIFCFVDPSNGWAIGNPKIYHTTNGGTNWAIQYTDTTSGKFTAIQFTDLNNGWVVGDSNKIFKTTDGGSNWTRVTNTGLSSDAYSKCVFFLNANDGWIGVNTPITWGITPQRAILHTTDGGTSWTWQYPEFLLDSSATHTSAVFSMFFTNTSDGWLVGDYGIIGHTTDGGTTGVAEGKNTNPAEFSLEQNYPNPFNPTTTITFSVGTYSHTSLRVYDVLGREVATIFSGELSAGNYSKQWKANAMPSGIYFYRLQSGHSTETKKLILLK